MSKSSSLPSGGVQSNSSQASSTLPPTTLPPGVNTTAPSGPTTLPPSGVIYHKEPFQLQATAKALIQCPVDIVCLGTDVLVADLDLRHVIRVDNHGNLVTKYDLSEGLGEVTGLTTYSKDFFVVQEKGITLISGEDKNFKSAQRRIYKPNVGKLGKAVALNQFNFIISDGSNLLQYNGMDNKIIPIQITTEGYGSISHIHTAIIKDERKYFLTFVGSHRVNIYSHFWTRIAGIGGKLGTEDGKLYWPRSTAVISKTHFIVADYNNHRVSLYKIDGGFVEHLLTKNADGIKAPVGLAYNGQKLWVLSYYYGKVSVSCWSLQIPK